MSNHDPMKPNAAQQAILADVLSNAINRTSADAGVTVRFAPATVIAKALPILTPAHAAVIAAAMAYCDAVVSYNTARGLGLSHLQADTPNTACLDAAHEIHLAVNALRTADAGGV